MELMPVGFISHGAPVLAMDQVKGRDLLNWANSIERPKALLVISAHWEKSPSTIGTTSSQELIYDFYGFPQPLYELKYPAPGAPELAESVKDLLHVEGIEFSESTDRGLDHGVWVPLLHMYPNADIPVLQLSLPSQLESRHLFHFGRVLAPLREQGILILGSGGITHNLREMNYEDNAEPQAWASDFEDWCCGVLTKWDLDSLINFRETSPQLFKVHPGLEHFLPLLVSAGAANSHSHQVSFPIKGFEFGNLSRTCVQFT